MKCPKCGYLGFETTDRCRNCQYDFSLTPFASDPELTLHGAERPARIDRLISSCRRLRARATRSAPPRSTSIACSAIRSPRSSRPRQRPSLRRYCGPPSRFQPKRPGWMKTPRMSRRPQQRPPAFAMRCSTDPIDEAALPFDDAPLMPPPAARTPLAVRRSTPEVPRNRPRTTRPVRTDSLDLEASVASRATPRSPRRDRCVAHGDAHARRARRRRADRPGAAGRHRRGGAVSDAARHGLQNTLGGPARAAAGAVRRFPRRAWRLATWRRSRLPAGRRSARWC